MSIDFLKSIYYEIISYFVLEKSDAKVTGVCNQCGNCCRQIIGPESEFELKIMKIIFPYYRYFYPVGKDEQGLILSCKHLKDNKCSIYSKRPLICKRYPPKYLGYNFELPDGCSYKINKKNFKDYL